MLKKLFGHSLLHALGPILPKVAMVLAMPWLTENLYPVDYGIYGVVTATTGALQALATLGLLVVLSVSFYHSPSRYTWRWRQIYGFFIWWSPVYALMLVCLLWLLLPDEASENYLLICLLNLPILIFGYGSLLGQQRYLLLQRPWPFMLRALLSGLVNVGLTSYLIIWEKQGYMGWFWGNFVGTTLLNLSYVYPVLFKAGLWPIMRVRWRHFREFLKLSLPMLPHFYAGYLLDFSDRLVMRVMSVPTELIGRYNSTYLFGNYFQMLGTTTGNALGPMLMQESKKGNLAAVKAMSFTMMGAFLAGTFLASVWLRELFALLIRNDELQAMYPLGVIIVMGYTYRPIYLAVNATLVLGEKTNQLWRISFGAGLGNLVLNLSLIPFFGYKMAAVTTWIALMYMGFSGFFLPSFRKLNTQNYYPLRWLLLILASTLFAYCAVDYALWIKVLITLGALLGFAAFVLRMRKDLELLGEGR